MIEMTLSSRHRIRNSNPGGLRPSTLPLGHGGSHNTNFHTWMGKKHFLFLSNCRDREPNPVKSSGANHYPRAPALFPNCSAKINPRIFPYASPNIGQHFGETSPKIPQRFVNTSRAYFLMGPHFRNRHRSQPEHVFFIASTTLCGLFLTWCHA